MTWAQTFNCCVSFVATAPHLLHTAVKQAWRMSDTVTNIRKKLSSEVLETWPQRSQKVTQIALRCLKPSHNPHTKIGSGVLKTQPQPSQQRLALACSKLSHNPHNKDWLWGAQNSATTLTQRLALGCSKLGHNPHTKIGSGVLKTQPQHSQQ